MTLLTAAFSHTKVKDLISFEVGISVLSSSVNIERYVVLSPKLYPPQITSTPSAPQCPSGDLSKASGYRRLLFRYLSLVTYLLDDWSD